MIEILFGESEAGSMKAAKNKRIIGTANGPTSIWMAGKRTPPRNPFTGWVEGTPEEVICLGFMLDVGDIKEPVDSSYRKELIYSMYAQDQWEQDEEMEEELKRVGDFYAKEIEHYIQRGEISVVEDSENKYARMICDCRLNQRSTR